MSVVKRKTSSAAKAEAVESILGVKASNTSSSGGARGKKSQLDNNKNEIDNLLAEITVPGQTIWVHNVTGTEFHVPPVTNKPDDADSAIKFEVYEILPFEKSEIENKRFKKCLMDGKLKIISEADISKIEKERDKSSKKSGKAIVGLHQSGLPLNKKAAIDFVFELTDVDELEAYSLSDDREWLQDIIESHIDELENGEFQD